MAAKSLLNTGILFTDRRDFYISPQVVKELWTDVAPFTTILSNRGTEQTPDPDFKMFTHESGFIQQQLSINNGGGYTWSSTGLPGETIANVAYDGLTGLGSAGGDHLVGLECEVLSSDYATHKGVVLITSATSSVLGLKALGNPYSATDLCSAIVDNDVLYVIGNAFASGTTSPASFSDELSVVWNSTQIQRTSVEVEGDLYQAALRGYSNELARLRMEKSKEHKIQKERMFLFGVRSNGTNHAAGDTFGDNHQTDANSKKVRTTMGLISALKKYGNSTTTADAQNVFTVNAATYTYSNLVDDTSKVFQYIPTGGEKIMVVGQGFMNFWSKVEAGGGFVKRSGFDNIQMWPQERHTLGFNFRRLETPNGVIQLVWAPVLRGPYVNTGVIIDDENLSLAQYRAPMYKTNIKTDDGYDGVKDEFFSQDGLRIDNIKPHSLWTLTNS